MTGIRITQLELYNAFIKRKKQVFAISVIATIVIALFAISAGSLNIPISEIIRTIIGNGESQSQAVIMGIRLPRVTAAILVGAALAVSGAVSVCYRTHWHRRRHLVYLRAPPSVRRWVL